MLSAFEGAKQNIKPFGFCALLRGSDIGSEEYGSRARRQGVSAPIPYSRSAAGFCYGNDFSINPGMSR